MKDKTAALMCSEFDIEKCHRRFIAEQMVRKGIDVIVIDKEGNTNKFSPMEKTKKPKRRIIGSESKNQSKLTGF